MHKEPISVCMACYYGEEYIEEQMISILQQLGADDELIIIDDHSQDKTGQIVQGMNDKRIRYIFNEKTLIFVSYKILLYTFGARSAKGN